MSLTERIEKLEQEQVENRRLLHELELQLARRERPTTPGTRITQSEALIAGELRNWRLDERPPTEQEIRDKAREIDLIVRWSIANSISNDDENADAPAHPVE